MKSLVSNQFVRNVVTLATGSFIAQIINIIISPITTRLYTPEDYAALSLFSAFVLTIVPIACARFDIAIVIGKDLEDSKKLLTISIWTALALNLVGSIFLIVTMPSAQVSSTTKALGGWILAIPTAITISATLNALRNFANCNNKYRSISYAAILQAICGGVLSIILGVYGLGSSGMIISMMAGSTCALVVMIYLSRESLYQMRWKWSDENWEIIKRYRNFPIYNALPVLVDQATLAMPVFFLAVYFEESIVGYYALLTRVAAVPLSFISSSVSQVHLRKTAELVHRGEKPSKYLLKITFALFLIVAPPSLVITCYAPTLFAVVFGAQWQRAGELLAVLMPALALRFVVSTVSPALLAAGGARLAAGWQGLAFASVLLTFLLLGPRLSVDQMFLAMAITDIILYSIYYMVIWIGTRKPRMI